MEYIYEGTEAALRTFAETSRGQIDEYYIDQDGAKHRLVMRVSNRKAEGENEIPQDDVRMDIHRIGKDITEHPNFGSCTSDQMVLIRKALDEKSQENSDAARAVLSGDALATFELALKNVNEWTIYHPVLIKTRIASSAYSFDVSYANCGRIISSDFVANEAGLTGLLRFTLPDFVSDDARFVYGWLKHYPSYGPVSANRYQFTQEYEYGKWATLLYGALVTGA